MKKVIFITEGTISPRVLAAVLSSGLERFAHIETIDEKKENLQKLAELIAASGEPVLGAKKVVESLTFELKKLELKENPALLDLTTWYRRFDKTAKKASIINLISLKLSQNGLGRNDFLVFKKGVIMTPFLE